MKTNQYTLFLLLLVVLGSCSKEKLTEKKLHRVGTWNITELEWTIVSQSVTDTSLFQGIRNGSEVGAGTFTFTKNGGGSYNLSYDGINKNGNILWNTDNTESVSIVESTSLVGTIANFFSFTNGTSNYSINQEMYTYNFTRTGKNVFEGGGAGVMQYIDANSVNVAQYSVTFDHIKIEK